MNVCVYCKLKNKINIFLFKSACYKNFWPLKTMANRK
jgi:hypothetical protein